MKIIDKIQHAMEVNEPFYSFEFFPPKTAAGVENLCVILPKNISSLDPCSMPAGPVRPSTCSHKSCMLCNFGEPVEEAESSAYRYTSRLPISTLQ